MRELHAGLLAMQGIPILVGIFLALWLGYHIRAALLELRAIRGYLESINYLIAEQRDKD